MHIDNVEIYSDETNRAVMRHPYRKFPGVLIQGDTLYGMCQRADSAMDALDSNSPAYEELNQLRNHLWDFLNHYKVVLGEHNHSLPFVQMP